MAMSKESRDRLDNFYQGGVGSDMYADTREEFPPVVSSRDYASELRMYLRERDREREDEFNPAYAYAEEVWP